MRRIVLPLLVAAAAAGCVSVDGMPDPHGALGKNQRLVVNVYPSPGPWIITASDSKAESAAKITPLGFLLQSGQDLRTLSVSQNLQQYLPRPRLGEMVQETLLKGLKATLSTGTVQTGQEAGIAVLQLAEWNKSKDQLDWRQRYYMPDPDSPAPRDYARILTLDDALILDVNVSFGTDANDADNMLPAMSAASRVYRGDTSHLLWEHEDVVEEQSSSMTLSDYQLQPWLLTESLKKLAPSLGSTVAASFLKAFLVAPSTATHVHTPAPTGLAGGGGGGLVPMSAFTETSSTAAPAGLVPAAALSAPPALSTATVVAPSAPPWASTGTIAVPASGATAPSAAPPAVVPAAAPAVPASTSPAVSPSNAPPH